MSNVRFNCSVGVLRGFLALVLLVSSLSAFALGNKGYVWYALGGPVPNGQDGPSYCQSLSSGTNVYSFSGEKYNAKNDIVYGICASSGGGGFEMERSNVCLAGYSLFNGDQCRKVCSPPSFNFPNDSDTCEVSPEPCKVTENYVAAVNQCRPKTCPTGEYLNALGVCVANPPDTSTSSSTGDTTTSASSGTTTTTTGDTSTTGSTSSTTTSGSTTSGDTTTTSGSTTSGGSTSTSGGSTSTTSGSTGDTTSTSGTTGDTTTSGSTTTTTSGTTGSTTSGGTTSGEGDETPPDDFCTKNPSLTICKNSSVSGACASTTCEGDAITCAILRTQQKRDCEDHDDQNPLVKLGRSLLDGNDPEKGGLPSIKNAQEVDVSKDISYQSWGGSGACFADKNITVMGRQIVIPVSKVCPYLEVLRYCIMLIASIISFRMVSGAVLRV